MEDKNIIELLTSINKQLQELVKTNEEKNKRAVINLPQLQAKLGVSRGFLDSHPWLQPNLGKSDYPGNKKWDVETVDRWLAIPVEERKAMYEKQAGEMLEALEKKVNGGVKNGTTRN